MTKKVLFIHDGPRYKDINGIQYGGSNDIELFKRYHYLGDDIKFLMRVFLTKETNEMTNLNKAGLKIIEVPPFNRPLLIKNYYKSKKIISNAISNSDIILIRLPSTIGSVAYNIAKEQDKPILVEVVACPWDSLTNYSILGKVYAPFSMLKLKRITKKAAFVTYVTNTFLQKRYPSYGITSSFSDVILKQTDQTVLKKKINRYLKLKKSNNLKISITTLGAVDIPYKGQSLVLHAIYNLRKKGINITYNIAGKGNFSRLNKIINRLNIKDNINYLGTIDHSKVFSLLDDTDIYIQPSQVEGLPRAVVEAMSRGCACIGSNIGGIPELLDKKAIFKSVYRIISVVFSII